MTHIAPERVWAAELDESALRFQAETFGVNVLRSRNDPASFDPSRENFDVVLPASVFSHLPPALFRSWLRRLVDLLSDDGILIFSTHGSALAPDPLTVEEASVVFVPQSETNRLFGEDYGTTFVTESFVRQNLLQGTPVDLVRFPFGLCGEQDIYVAGKRVHAVGELPWSFPPRGRFVS